VISVKTRYSIFEVRDWIGQGGCEKANTLINGVSVTSLAARRKDC